MSDSVVFAILAGLFGLLIGSFLNVCIYRWTRDLSVVKPRSACPECNHPIAWYDNVPLMSFAVLGGRCRHCKTPIPWTYPAVEFLNAFFFAYFVALQGLNLAAAKDCLFSAIMIGLIFSDLDTRLLPDEFTIGGLFAGLALSLLVPLPPTLFALLAELTGAHLGLRGTSLGEALFGALIPSGAMWMLGWIFEKIRHKEYLGFGDVKMIAMMGAFLGLSGVIVTLLFGSLLGSIGGYAWMKITRKDPATYYLPFASFLGAGALIVVAAHGGITGWYEHLLR
jgi:leader peptidase (prepilin peptidase) / N-methyltransferase